MTIHVGGRPSYRKLGWPTQLFLQHPSDEFVDGKQVGRQKSHDPKRRSSGASLDNILVRSAAAGLESNHEP